MTLMVRMVIVRMILGSLGNVVYHRMQKLRERCPGEKQDPSPGPGP